MKKTSNKPRNIKYHNQKLILSMFREKEILSISEIAVKINLSKTTVTKVVNNFEAKGLVLATGKGNSTDVGGKKPEMFAFNAAFSYVVALSIGTDFISCAAMDLKCAVISQQTIKCDPQSSYEEAVQNMAAMIHKMAGDLGPPADRIHPIVIGCEGIIDANNGIIHYTIHHRWGKNLRLRDDLAKALAFPSTIYVDNNLRLAGYIDMIINNGRTYDSQAVITTTHSAGGSVLENLELVHGANGFIGEFGHMIIEPYSDIQCDCGGYGCFGALVSPDNLLARAYKEYGGYPGSLIYPKARDGILTITDVFNASNKDDTFACWLMDMVIHYFAIVIHNIVLLRDPERIVIQGVYSTAGDYFLSRLKKKVNSLPFYKMDRDLLITYTAVSDINSYLIGAAYYAVDILLNINSLYD
jgi:predicted NBD/HSP70 family sugar kinase/predicted transcriptional regulator